MFLKVAISLVLLVSLTESHKNGPPKTACVTMAPFLHCNCNPQSGPCPFEIVPESKVVQSNGTLNVKVVIKSSAKTGLTFKGFMLMAFASPGDDLTAIGTFSNPVNGKTLDCQSFGPKAAFVHQNNTQKSEATVNWKPPAGYSGDIMFRASFVQVLDTYWVRESAPFTVKVVP